MTNDSKHRRRQTWAIVLAGGEGTRLANLTAALHGRPTPKQFAMIGGRRSMLQDTLRRLAPIVPAKRTLVVIGRGHVPWIRTQLCGPRAPLTLVQPASRGTATAIALALQWIRLRDPDADILISPSDHHVAAVDSYRSAVRHACDAAHDSGRVTLVGVKPEYDDPDFGWIVEGARAPNGSRALERFVEKPDAVTARSLRASGALWNTFLLAGPATTLWSLINRNLPAHARELAALDCLSFAPGSPDLDRSFDQLAAADFSRDVLQHASDLGVVTMADSGWDDWGTPDRVLRSLGNARALELRELLASASCGDRRTADHSHHRACAGPLVVENAA